LTTRHPQADDPQSKHYERKHPSRTRNRPSYLNVDPSQQHSYDSTVYSMNATYLQRAVFHALVAMQVANPSLTHSPKSLTAWVTENAHVDTAFTDHSREADSWLVISAMAARAPQIVVTSDMGDLTVPASYRHAITGPLADRWKEAIAKELGGLVALGT